MPKSYNHLYEKFLSDENIEKAIINASKGKRNRKKVRAYYENPKKYIPYFRNYASHFYNKPHVPKLIYDGITKKKRTIIVPTYEEQVIHHMMVNILIPIFSKTMYEHTYASIPNRGSHKAKKFIKKWIVHDPVNTKYCLKMDIRKYFDSIPHQTLKVKLRRIIHDDKFLDVLFTIIDVTDIGLPLGFYTSQWLSNWYLEGLDHFIKEKLHAKYYVRYMDDMVIFSDNKETLHRMRRAIESYLVGIGLKLKLNYHIFPITNKIDLNFMGFRFYKNRITLRKTILKKAKRKAIRIHKKGRLTIHDVRQMLSYLGWIDATSMYNYYKVSIKPYVNFQKLKRRVSSYDKRRLKYGVASG